MEQKTVELVELGILPNCGEDYIDRLAEIFEEYGDDTEFVFEKGVYRFHTAGREDRRVIKLVGKKNVTINCSDSTFVFFGDEQPFTFDKCENITLKKLTVDWDNPLSSEGTVVDKDICYIDVRINTDAFPCEIRNFNLHFAIGDGEYSEMAYSRHTIYDARTLAVAVDTADMLSFRSVERIEDDLFRFYTAELLDMNSSLRVGDMIAFSHIQRNSNGIVFTDCNNVTVNHVRVYSADNGAILFSGCEDVFCSGVDLKPNKVLGRNVSGPRRGLYVENCRGDVIVERSTFFGLMNDPVNIHGLAACLVGKKDGNILECAVYSDSVVANLGTWARVGDTVSVVDRRNAKSVGTAVITGFERTGRMTFEIEVGRDADEFGIDDIRAFAVENLSAQPRCTLSKNFFGSGRARGLLIATSGKSLVDGNVFESPGAAILVAGDYNFWFECGACGDLTMTNNVFTEHCCRSKYMNSQACITIDPQLGRTLTGMYYHAGIRITDNTFMSSDVPMLDASNVDGLLFSDNRVYYIDRSKFPKNVPELCRAKNCRNITLKYNVVIGCRRVVGYSIDNCVDINTEE